MTPPPLTEAGRFLLRRIAEAGDLGFHPGPSQGQAGAKLARDGYVARRGTWGDRLVLTDQGRAALEAAST